MSLFIFFEGLYEKHWLNILNASFYTNLTILSILSFHYETKNDNRHQNTATYTSLSFAFVNFLIIVSYHTYKLWKKTGFLSQFVVRVQENECWRAAAGWWNRCRKGYIRLPQQDHQERELNDDFDRERLVDEDVNWERELDERRELDEQRELDEENNEPFD